MLKELAEYGRHLGGEPGFRVREVKWCVEVGNDARLVGVFPLGDGKSGQQLSACPDMHAMNSGGKAHFLVESAQYIALLLKGDEDAKKLDGIKARRNFYLHLLCEAGKEIPRLDCIARMLGDEEQVARLREILATAKAKPMDWMTWRVDDVDPRDLSETQAWWRQWRRADLVPETNSKQARRKDEDSAMVCMLSGELVEPLATHPKINGLGAVGGLAMGDALISFDKTKAAFSSLGLQQSANAAMGAEAAQHYVDGLNDLIRNHSYRLVNTLVAHWFKERIVAADDPFALLYGLESDDQTAISAQAEARRLLDAIRSGERRDVSENQYYAVTLSGASGRVMIRDWMVGSFEALVTNVNAWFDDLSIVHRDGKALARSPRFLAVCGALVIEDLKDLPATTSATLWRSAAFGTPIPAPVMAQALLRFRSELVKGEKEFSHARMGLIKAYFLRKPSGGDTHMQATVNEEHPSPAYHCGRLLAVLAGLQRAALGDVGAGVVQRFYAACSQTPGLTLGRLVTNARNHIGKLDGWLAWWYEEQIANIMVRLGDGAPRTLDLEGQGLFALGYYQQLAHLRAGKKAGTTDETNDKDDTQVQGA